MSLTVGELNAYVRADNDQFVRVLDASEARFRVFAASLTLQLRDLERIFSRSRIAPQVDTAAARAELRALRTEADRLARDRTLRVRVDSSTARSGLRDIDRAAQDTERSGSRLGRLTGVLGGIGSAAGSAAGSLASAAGTAGLMAAALGSVIPIAAGLAAALVDIAPAAAVGATGVFALAGAFGAVKLGLGGVGSAFKAALAPPSGGGGGGGAAGSARQAADAIRQLRDAREQAAYANEQAAQQEARAERQVADAQRQSKKAQDDLNASRVQATRDLEDLNNQLIDAQFAETDAANAVQDALDKLNADKASRGSVTDEQQARDQLAYDEAVQALKEQQLQVRRLSDDTAAANKAGVDGSKTMVDARQTVADANQNLADQEQALTDARVQQARTAAQGLENIQRAQEALAASAGGAAGGGGGVNKLNQALAALSPNARAFVLQVLALRGAWTALQQDVQNRLFQGLAVSLKGTAGAVLPVLRTGLVQTAGALNAMALGAMAAARGVAKDGTLGQAMASAAGGLHNLAGIPGIVIKALTQLAAAAGPAFQSLTAAAGRGAASIGEKLDAAFKSGRLKTAIDQAVTLIKQIGKIGANVGEILGSLFQAANASGGGFLNTLETITRSLATAFKSDAVQDGLRALFQTMALIARTVGPLLITALQAVAPVLVALAPPVQRLVTALGAALGPIIAGLGPVLVVAAQAFGALLDGLQPLIAALPQLMGPIGDIVTAFANSAPAVGALVLAFNPFLGILILLAPVLDKLISPIGSLITALSPLIDAVGVFAGQLAQALVPVVVALSPVLGALAGAVGALLTAFAPLLPVIGDLIAAILPVFTPILKGLSTAFLRLAGPIGQIARALGTALKPVIEGLSEVIDDLAAKYLATLMGVFDQLIPLVPVLTPVLIQLGISIGQILTAVAPLVPQFGMLSVMLVSQLLPAVIPLIPPLAQLTTMLLILATDVITGVVVPAFSALVAFLGGLQKAFKPAVDAVRWLTTTISDLFTWLADHLVGHSVIPDMVRSIVSWFARLPGMAVAALGNIAGRLGGAVSAAAGRMVGAARDGVASAVWWVGTLPARAFNVLGDLSGTLYHAGTTLISGFISGIRDMIPGLSSLLGGITNMLPDWKGPPAKDAVLLRPAGQLIMSGFMGGIADQVPLLRRQLQDLTGSLPDSVGTGYGALTAPPRYGPRGEGMGAGSASGSASGRQEFLFRFEGNGDPVLTALSKSIRVKAGNRGDSVQYALGQGG